jgi:zinc protease
MKIFPLLIAAAGLAAAQVRLPQYTHEVLPNGAVLDVMVHKGVPLVTVQVLVKGGVESEPPQLAGLASVTAELLRRGAGARTADRFSEDLDFIGANFGARANAQATVISTDFMAKDADRALDLLADAVLRPAFPEEEVQKTLTQRIDSSRAMKDSPGTAAAQYYEAFFFGPDHPYGRVADELSLKRITRADITGYHSRMYTGRNLIVAAVGDFDPAEMKAKLAKAFGQAPPGTAYQWLKDAPPKSSGARLLLVDKPDATQTYFNIGNPGITRTSQDRIAVWLVNTLFGGRFTSMLNDALRVNAGLTYGASSRVDEDRLTGSITMSSYTRTDATVRAIDIALDMLRTLREKGISAEQLASVKAYVKGGYPTRRLETAQQLAGVLGEMELFGLDRSDTDDLFARIDAVTLEQANAAVKAHFGSGDLVFTLVGNAAKIREGVRKYAPKMIEMPITTPGFQIRQ